MNAIGTYSYFFRIYIKSGLNSGNPFYKQGGGSNTEEFKDLNELMQLKNVKSVANGTGIGLDGIKIKLDRNLELLGREYMVLRMEKLLLCIQMCLLMQKPY